MLRNVFGKVLWDHRISVWWWVVGLVGLAALTVSFYPTIRDQAGFTDLLESLPAELLAVFGVEDASAMATPVGLVNSRLYGSIGSILVIVFAVSLGSQAIAGEEERGSMDILLAQPIRRTMIVLQSLAAMAVLVSILAASLMVTLLVTDPWFGLDLPFEGVLAANIGLVLLALVHGALALAVGGLTGNRRLTVGVATAVVVAGFFVNGLAAIVEALRPFREASPFHWFLGPEPLGSGFDWPGLALMATATVLLTAVAAWGFDRRDVAA